MSLANARQSLIATARQMETLRLNQGVSGNLSLRDRDGFWITPADVPPAELAPEDLVWMDFDGHRRGQREPSGEWLLHRDILRAYPEHQAVLHAHPIHGTALACLERELPAFHYRVAVAGGDSVRCAPYHTFGTPELVAAAVEALRGRRACLLAHHGLIAAADSLAAALAVAAEVEALCEIFTTALAAGGEPPRLSPQQMADVLQKLAAESAQTAPQHLP